MTVSFVQIKKEIVDISIVAEKVFLNINKEGHIWIESELNIWFYKCQMVVKMVIKIFFPFDIMRSAISLNCDKACL